MITVRFLCSFSDGDCFNVCALERCCRFLRLYTLLVQIGCVVRVSCSVVDCLLVLFSSQWNQEFYLSRVVVLEWISAFPLPPQCGNVKMLSSTSKTRRFGRVLAGGEHLCDRQD